MISREQKCNSENSYQFKEKLGKVENEETTRKHVKERP